MIPARARHHLNITSGIWRAAIVPPARTKPGVEPKFTRSTGHTRLLKRHIINWLCVKIALSAAIWSTFTLAYRNVCRHGNWLTTWTWMRPLFGVLYMACNALPVAGNHLMYKVRNTFHHLRGFRWFVALSLHHVVKCIWLSWQIHTGSEPNGHRRSSRDGRSTVVCRPFSFILGM